MAERPYVAVRTPCSTWPAPVRRGWPCVPRCWRASVAALRATVLAFHELPEEERRLETARRLADQAFAILRDNPG
ncbi:hypothetical protein [Nonomuraea sp. NPDC049709]|uniref:hypothetical protein n=1 Tax=Nonomuraea sp. NPDC049709 TaxID=3154736 RepID=UPI00341C3B65